MAGFTSSVFIANHTPAQVFDFATDPAMAPRIAPNIKELVPVTPGPLAVGSRLREVRVINGKESIAELEVRAFDRPGTHAMGSAVEGIDVHYEFRYVAVDGGTRVDLVATVTGKGLKKVMAPLVAAFLKREDGKHLEHLRDALLGRG